jgi:5-methylcytosine-specific restriction endonuclease McrA
MYSDAPDNPKIGSLSDEKLGQWLKLVCVAARYDGQLPDMEKVAFHLRCTEEKARKMVANMVRTGLFDASGAAISPHDWDVWQRQSDDSTPRVEKYRARVRENGCTVGGYLKHKTAVFQRDGHACAYCASTDKLVLDHMVPVIQGGDDDPANLCCCCKKCNAGKAGRTPDQAGMVFVNPVTESVYRENLSRLSVTGATVTDTVCHRIDQNRTETEQKQNRTEQTGARVDDQPTLFECYFGMFEASGKPLNETDKRKSAMAFLSMSEPDQIAAHDDAARKFHDGTWPTADLTPFPSNHIAGRAWTRTAKPRTLPDSPRKPSKSAREEAWERA